MTMTFQPMLSKLSRFDRTLFKIRQPLRYVVGKIADMKSTNLTDLFDRKHTYLRISLTEKCNLRCQYCMPISGVPLTEKSNLLTNDELVYLARIFATLGVTKIRLTGGEPTIRKDLSQLIQTFKSIKGIETVAITTNGLVLTKKLVALQKAGLDVLNISLDTLNPAKYQIITRRKGWEHVMMGIDLALQLGYSPLKVNCVLIKGQYSNWRNISFKTYNMHRVMVNNLKPNLFARMYSSSQKSLTHVDEQGKVSMVNVSAKDRSYRTASAKGTVVIGEHVKELIKQNNIKKGDVLSIAQVAGISAAKNTWNLIPLCHNISLTYVKVDIKLNEIENTVEIESHVQCEGKTGVEMEALTAVSVAALTVYDMCKAANKSMVVSNVRLIKKMGGVSGEYIGQ